jgi:hypothetical protein
LGWTQDVLPILSAWRAQEHPHWLVDEMIGTHPVKSGEGHGSGGFAAAFLKLLAGAAGTGIVAADLG